MPLAHRHILSFAPGFQYLLRTTHEIDLILPRHDVHAKKMPYIERSTLISYRQEDGLKCQVSIFTARLLAVTGMPDADILTRYCR